MSNLWRDIRLAARIARRVPTATVGLLITMAAAVAGCATVFAVVNAVLWRPLLWPGEEAIGRTIRLGGPSSQEPWSTVVGVVEDVRYRLDAAPLPMVYRPVSQKAPTWLISRSEHAENP